MTNLLTRTVRGPPSWETPCKTKREIVLENHCHGEKPLSRPEYHYPFTRDRTVTRTIGAASRGDPSIAVIGSSDKRQIVFKGSHVSPVAGPNAIRRFWPELNRWLSERSLRNLKLYAPIHADIAFANLVLHNIDEPHRWLGNTLTGPEIHSVDKISIQLARDTIAARCRP